MTQIMLSNMTLLMPAYIVIAISSSMIRYYIPITFLYYFTISLALFIYSQNIDFLLNWVNVISFYLMSSTSDTIWQLMITTRRNPSSNSSLIDLFHLMMYLFSTSLVYVLSTEIMSHSLNQILNHFVIFNVYVTVKVYQSLLGRPHSTSYSKDAKRQHHYITSSSPI